MLYGRCQEEKRERRGTKVFEEIMIENFPNMVEETNIQAQEAQGVPKKKNPNNPYEHTS